MGSELAAEFFVTAFYFLFAEKVLSIWLCKSFPSAVTSLERFRVLPDFLGISIV